MSGSEILGDIAQGALTAHGLFAGGVIMLVAAERDLAPGSNSPNRFVAVLWGWAWNLVSRKGAEEEVKAQRCRAEPQAHSHL